MALELFSAVQRHDQKSLDRILNDTTNPVNKDWLNQSGESVLTVAVKCKNYAAVDQLLAYGYLPNHAPRGQQSFPLLHAVKHNKADDVIKLLLWGADPNKDQSEHMINAVLAASAEVVSVLLNHGLETAKYLIKAVEKHRLDMVQLFLMDGPKDQNGVDAALKVAAGKGYLEIVQELLSNGASAQSSDLDGNTALHHVAGFKVEIDLFAERTTTSVLLCESDYIVILQALVTAGADVNAANVDGCTALHVAALCGHIELAQALIAAGANVNAVDKSGRTPLMIAVGNFPAHTDYIFRGRENADYSKKRVAATNVDYLQIVDVLLAAGTFVNAQDRFGRTALMSVVRIGVVEFLHKLIAAGTDTALVDSDGKSALAIAIDGGYTKAAQTFQQAAADAAAAQAKAAQSASAPSLNHATVHETAPVPAVESASSLDPVCPTAQSADKSDTVDATLATPAPTHQPAEASFIPSRAAEAVPAARALPVTSSVGELDTAQDTNSNSGSAHTSQLQPTTPEPPLSQPSQCWLTVQLSALGVSPAHIQLCEKKLIVQEGFTSADLFASADPAKELTPAYFARLGITALGLQKVLLRLHAALNKAVDASAPPATNTQLAKKRTHDWKMGVIYISIMLTFTAISLAIWNVGLIKQLL